MRAHANFDEIDPGGEADAGVVPAVPAQHLGTGRELAIRRRLLLDATTTSYEDALGAHLAACDRAVRSAWV